MCVSGGGGWGGGSSSSDYCYYSVMVIRVLFLSDKAVFYDICKTPNNLLTYSHGYVYLFTHSDMMACAT